MCRRLDERTGWCGRCTAEHAEAPARLGDARKMRRQIAVYAQLRQIVWSELPSANGNRANLRMAIVRLTDRIDDSWELVRAVEKAPRFEEKQAARADVRPGSEHHVDVLDRERSRGKS
jgi:hypothetical protein